MRCIVKKTLDIIIEKNNDYLVKVKGNQPNLFNAVKRIVETTQPVSSFTEEKRTRGRDEYRAAAVYLPTDQIPKGWRQLNRIIHVERKSQRKDKLHHTDSYYISSIKENDAKIFADGIRGHWLIENKLHYVKDVIMREDYIRNNSNYAPMNMSIIRNIAINIFSANGYKSPKHASLFFASNASKLLKLLMFRT